MDQRERIGDFEEGLRSMMDGRLSSLWTALPGIVQSFNPLQMTAVVKSAIKFKQTSPDGSIQWKDFPLFLDVPIVWPSGGLFTMTFPVTEGDEVLVVFASRCIDSWWQNGESQNQFEFRMHDLSDGFAIPGPVSQPNVIPNISTDAAELRTNDGTVKISIFSDGAIEITAPVGVTINGDLTVEGTIVASEEISAQGGAHTVSAHVHPGVATGGSNTGLPVD